jgi:IS605 OrfB family transposase
MDNDDNPSQDSKPKKITKTLTFGLGRLFGYDKKKKTPFEFEDEKRKQIYQKEIPQGFRDFARLCNATVSLLYCTRILKNKLEDLGFNTGYKPILEKLQIDTHLSGMILCQAFQVTQAHFAGEHGRSLMREGSSVLPTHKSDGTHPLYFHKKAVELLKHEDHYYLAYQLFADRWAETAGLPNWVAFQIKIKPRDKSGATQLDKVIDKDWGHGSGQLVKNKRKVGPRYLMHLSVSYTPDPYKQLDEKTIMGIDLGVMSPAAVHVRNNGIPEKWAMLVGNGRQLLATRGIIRGEIKRLLRALKRKDSPLDGPARDAARARLRELRQREQRVIKLASRRIAAHIAEIARRQGAGTWQMEDLGLGIKEDTWLAQNWAPGALKDAIRWQAKQLGVDLKFVNPAYTSQMCSSVDCHHIDPANRPKGQAGAAVFKCTKCGYEDHADKNAARNLSDPNIEKLITDLRSVVL